MCRARLLVGAVNELTAGAFTADEEMLVDHVKTLTVDQTAHLIRWWKVGADPDGAEEDAQRQWENRRLHLSVGMNGTGHLDGYFDPETTALLRGALETVSEELYRVDATAMTATPSPPRMAVVDLHTLEGRAGRRCEFDDGGAITPGAARRLACEASLVRVITDGASAVLDLGMATPTPNTAQRRALRVRDKGCVVPGCVGGPPDGVKPTTSSPSTPEDPPIWSTCACCAPIITFTRADGITIDDLPRAA